MLVHKQEGRPIGDGRPAPFIVGASRSGTTLLRLMLDAHPDLAIPPETYFLRTVSEQCSIAPEPRACFLKTLTDNPRWPDFRIDHEEFERRVIALEPFTLTDGLRTFYRMYAERFGKHRWGDKSPRYRALMGQIQILLPEARFVHLIRDGRDVALSIRDLWWGPNSVGEAAGWWVASIRQARREMELVDSYLEIRYEDLILDCEDTLKRICDFVDLPWDPRMLEYYHRADERLSELDDRVREPATSDDAGTRVTAEARRQIHALTRKPPEKERVARWQREMTADEQECFVGIAGETLAEFGYATSS